MGSIATSLAQPVALESNTKDIIYLRHGNRPSVSDIYFGNVSGVYGTGDDMPTTQFTAQVKFQLDRTSYYFSFDIQAPNTVYHINYVLKRMEAVAILTQEVKVTSENGFGGQVGMEHLKSLKYIPSFDGKNTAGDGGNYLITDSPSFFPCFLDRLTSPDGIPPTTASVSGQNKPFKFYMRLESIYIPRFNFPPIKGIFGGVAQ